MSEDLKNGGKSVGQVCEVVHPQVIGQPQTALVVSGDLPLSSEQQKSLELMVKGHSVADTARSVGVNRGTIHRWLKTDSTFAAALNRWMEELEQNTRARLMSMAAKASDAVEKALDAGNAPVGLQVLKGLGILAPRQTPRLTDPADLQRQMEIDRMRGQVNLSQGEIQVRVDTEKADRIKREEARQRRDMERSYGHR